MDAESLFNRYGRYVFALTGFELLLDAANDLQLAVRRELALVSGAEEAVGGEAGAAAFIVAVVAHHVHGTTHLHLVFRCDAAFNTRQRRSDITYAEVFRVGRMRDCRLGKAVAFDEPQAELAIPVEHLRGQRCGSRCGQTNGVETELTQYLPLHNPAKNGDAEQAIEPWLRHLCQYSLAKAQVEPGNREEQCRFRPLQVSKKAFLAGSEVDGTADVQAGGLNDAALRNMCQRKIRDESLAAVHIDQPCDAVPHMRKDGEAMH